MEVEALILAAIIGAIPTAAIALLGLMMRRNSDLSGLLASKAATERTLVRLDTTLREERDKRDELEKLVYTMPIQMNEKFIHREDHVRFAAQCDKKMDNLYLRLERLTQNPRDDARD